MDSKNLFQLKNILVIPIKNIYIYISIFFINKGNWKSTLSNNALEQFTTNLNKEALEGRIDPLIGRTSEDKNSN